MNTNDDTSPSPQGQVAGPKRLRRSADGSVAGVAKGLARYLGVETKWVRIAFLASLLFGGGGFFLYLAAWLAIPDENDPRTDAFVLTQNVTRLIAAGVFAVFAFGAVSGTATLSAGLLIPAALVGGGIYLLMQSDDSTPRVGGQYPKAETSAGAAAPVPPPPTAAPAEESSSTPPPVTSPASTPDPEDDRDPLLIEAEKLMSGEFYTDSTEVLGYDPPHWAVTKGETEVATAGSRRKPRLTWAALGMATLVSALLFVTNADPGFVAYAGIFLGFSVAGFLLSLPFRRPAWGLLPVAVLSLLLTVGAATVPSFSAGFGERTVRLTGIEREQSSFELGFGRLAIDMTDLMPTADRTVSATLGFGQIDLELPSDVRVELVIVDDTMLEYDDGTDDWVSAGERILVNPDAPAEPVLEVRADLDGFGVVSINTSREQTVPME